MPIIEPVIRPPSEADSFLLQVTTGCSSCRCTFCGAYVDKPFGTKARDEIEADIERCARVDPHVRKVFLLDGDALVLPNTKLVPVLELVNEKLPKVTRISSYANDYNILSKSDAELEELHQNRLRLIYMGLESGSRLVLKRCRKKSTVDGMIEAVRRAKKARIHSYVIVLLGLGGKALSQRHVLETAAALNRMHPRYLAFLSLMLIPGTALAREAGEGSFCELQPQEILMEMKGIIERLDLQRTLFRSNHASNFLPLEGRLPQDRGRLLDEIDMAVRGDVPLRSEARRGL